MPTAGQAFCTDCLKLRAVYVQAVTERNQLQDLEMQAVLSYREFTLSGELSLARVRQRRARLALVDHSRTCPIR